MPDVSIFKTLTVTAGDEDKASLYKVPPNCKLTVTRVEITFLADADLDLTLSLKNGELQQYPENGAFQGDSTTTVSTAKKEWGSGSDINVHYKNSHATESRTALINLSAEET